MVGGVADIPTGGAEEAVGATEGAVGSAALVGGVADIPTGGAEEAVGGAAEAVGSAALVVGVAEITNCGRVIASCRSKTTAGQRTRARGGSSHGCGSGGADLLRPDIACH